MGLRLPRAAVSLTLTTFLACGAHAAGVTPYFESSANQKPRGNAGLSVDADRVRLKADVALRTAERTQVVPHVSSSVTFLGRLALETNVNLSEWNGRDEDLDRTFDTRLHFKSSAPFFDELEGRIWRSPDGRSGRILKFGFYQILRETHLLQPLAIRANATVETTAAVAPAVSSLPSADTRRIGIETEVTGLMSRWRGRKALRLKMEKVEGARSRSASSVAYNHAWSLGAATRVGVNMQMQRATYLPTDDFQPSLDLTWRTDF